MAHRRRRCAVLAATLAVAAPGAATAKRTPVFPWATTSSPITMSLDGRLVWVVNPKADTVSVIWAGRDRVVGTIKVGDEPQAVAVDPANRYAYVANAAERYECVEMTPGFYDVGARFLCVHEQD